MSLPTNVDTGRVTGQFLVGIVDGVDTDQDLDAVPASGTVTFTASVPYLPDPTGAPDPATILTTSVVAVLDSAGYLCTPQRGTLKPAYRGVRLIATDDPDLSVTGWTWNVTYKFEPVNGTAVAIPTHGIAVPSGMTVDLSSAVKVPSSKGIGIEQAEAFAASAQAAAVSAADSAANAAEVTDAGVSALLSDTDSASRTIMTGFVSAATTGKLDSTVAAATYLKTANLDSSAASKVLTSGTSLNNAVKIFVNAAAAGKIATAEKGVAGGVATLDDGAKVPVAQVPDLSTTYAAKSVEMDKLDKTEAATTYAAKSVETTKLDASQKGAASGVAPLGADAKIPYANLPSRLGVSPKDYGAVGDVVTDANGALVSATDDSAAMQRALTAALDVGVLNLSGGTYYMGTTPLAATLKGPLTIAGNGTLMWASGNGIQLTQNSADHTVTVVGVTLLTNAQGAGVGLEIIGSGQNAGTGLQPRTKPRGVIDHVDIRGVRDTGIAGWGKGIRLVDIMNFIITKVHIDGYQPTQGNFVSTHGIEMVTETAVAKAVDVTITQSYVYLVQYALDVQGYEGVMVDDCSFIGVGTGYRNDAVDAGAPLASWRGGQIAFKNKGIEWNKIHQGIISDALIYTHSTSGTPDTATGITLTDSTTNRVTGCTFVSNNGMQTGVLIQGSLSKDNVVESSTYYSGITNPAVIGTGATYNKVRALTLRSAAQTIINNGGNTNVVELDDTGWITSGLTVTPGTNWTVGSYSLRKARNQATVRVIATYTGPDISTGVDGNLGDTVAATIPADYRPVFSWPVTASEFATRTWGAFISTTGAITLSNGLPSQTLTNGKTITFVGNFFTN